MSGQRSLFSPESVSNDLAQSEIRVLTWNVGNPSLERARAQFNWIAQQEANVLILTETKDSAGCAFLRDGLESAGFRVLFPCSKNGGYSVLIAEKGFAGQPFALPTDFLPDRIQAVRLRSFLGELLLVGLYVPSRGPLAKRNVDKRRFQDQIMGLLDNLRASQFKDRLVIGGDLNVVPEDHVPRYPFFGEWEYQFYRSFLEAELVDAYRFSHLQRQEHSWVGRSGDGYCFDYLFLSKCLTPSLSRVEFLHSPRFAGLSDHSALLLVIGRKELELRRVSS